MNTVIEALRELRAVLKGVQGVRFHPDLGAVISPPATALTPPRLQRKLQGAQPTTVTFQVAVIVGNSPDAVDQLLEFEQLVVDAVESLPAMTVTDTNPGRWPSGGAELYALLLDVDCAL